MHDNFLVKPTPENALEVQRELMSAMAVGDRQAFEQLYRLTSPRLFAVALRMLRRHAWAEEVLHDSYITAWNRAGSYNPALSSPMTWLTHIVRNRAIDWMRGSDNQLDELDDDVMNSDASDVDEPLQRLQQDSDAKILAACLAHLPAEQRQSLILAYYQGLSHGEVSSHLQQPLGTIKSWIRRALDHLKSCVGL
ncbi:MULTISPECIES: sigma-70 family RNA polymerase sigma factor [Rahnella]|jgi:RNA polymerase sigma-70 factor (ECF subfamily)|uniref:Sigma-70 family RNA polymerase sigma factor n=2 Tax=Rahnella TaxID=34037 RepID=A0A6M2B0K7_9GAMM|nr:MULTISPECIES: sigma-70 family RNA polymerase sigma factor [Rahnella]KAB8310987.1 sigma-70 family RNA polymerase sigma factor [Rouxiella chamberiensis]MBF7977868.1 sigma-70 family RNA polymerase sigma factor [Rahnella laticis]MBF7998415.1 sigma-70 family RNA polymerase sigma factor [Rahnella sp. LAC-M12]MBU9820395.1 sigma-70 family RNA polymerase sigma factor [Rahnella sp. BCC 1045]MBV6816721.1 sigma-70 family RNA polymerase sigma factor [Rahnella sp. PD12R]